jgi:hypothetical protein
MIILPTLPITFAVWLAVRFINRRERWARRLLIGIMAGAPVFYVLSFGPAVYLVSRGFVSPKDRSLKSLYLPLGWIALKGPAPVGDAPAWYAG